jgi:hypothetical protein
MDATAGLSRHDVVESPAFFMDSFASTPARIPEAGIVLARSCAPTPSGQLSAIGPRGASVRRRPAERVSFPDVAPDE